MYYFLLLFWVISGVYSVLIINKDIKERYPLGKTDAVDWALNFGLFLLGGSTLIYTLPMGAYYLHRYITNNRS